MEIIFLHGFPSKRWIWSGIHSLRKRNDERSSTNIIYM